LVREEDPPAEPSQESLVRLILTKLSQHQSETAGTLQEIATAVKKKAKTNAAALASKL